jgi:hypothetical protein
VTAQYVTLVLDSADARGIPLAQGQAVITPSGSLPDPADQLLIMTAPVVAAFGGRPSPPQARLVSTDSVGPQPNAWTYAVSFPGVPGSPRGFSFYLRFADGAVQYLSALAEVPAAQPGQQYLPLPSGTAVPGYVPVATGAGEASSWQPQSGGSLFGQDGGTAAGGQFPAADLDGGSASTGQFPAGNIDGGGA